MPKPKPAFEDLLTARSRSEIRTALAAMSLSLPQAQKLTAYAASLAPATHSLRLGIVHTYTSDLLDPWLAVAAALEGLELHTYHAPYGVSVQEAQPDSGLVRHQPDLTLLLLRREDLHPDFATSLPTMDSAQRDAFKKDVVERLHGLVSRFRGLKVGQIVLTVLPTMSAPRLGMYDAQSEFSESGLWSELKADIGRCVRETLDATLFLDLDQALQRMGYERFFDARFWYSARFPFATDGAREVARQVIGIGAAIKQPKAKVIVLDADNTLWGGIVGEDGIDGIALGPEYPGNVYVDFQRRILDFQQRGFIIALCSKNNPADVEQVLREHPHQILREENFAASRVNWISKADNLVSLAAELNLGLDSFVFVDDSDHECAAIRHQLPQVEVVQTPSRPVDIPHCLDQLARLEVVSLTEEDLARTALYATERRRRELHASIDKGGGDLRDYLATLQMKMRISVDSPAHVPRVSQLTQKTNQFNLTTRRYNEHQIQAFVRDTDWLVADFSLADVFGDSGIVGVALLHVTDASAAELDTFLMSCRVIGREAESAFLHAILRALAECGIADVVAEYKATAKNDMVRTFLPDQGFEHGADGRYRRNLRNNPPQPDSAFPIAIELTAESRDAPLAA